MLSSSWWAGRPMPEHVRPSTGRGAPLHASDPKNHWFSSPAPTPAPAYGSGWPPSAGPRQAAAFDTRISSPLILDRARLQGHRSPAPAPWTDRRCATGELPGRQAQPSPGRRDRPSTRLGCPAGDPGGSRRHHEYRGGRPRTPSCHVTRNAGGGRSRHRCEDRGRGTTMGKG